MMLHELLERYPALAACKSEIEEAVSILTECYKAGGKLLICGNGGSCADGDHIVGELMKGFLQKRPLSDEKKAAMRAACPQIAETTLSQLQGGLPAISLPSLTALNSAFCNDVDPELIYAQAFLSLAGEHDVLLGISTSGNAKNVAEAVTVAKAIGAKVIGLSGKGGGRLRALSDVCICVPETETFKIQELHLPVYHYICAEIEARFFA